jgi:adenine/guanine phosphoribosyltransferase-like PRPP-binding protein
MNPNRVYTKPICIIDDLINSGGSLQKAYDVFASNNIEVNKYLSLINFGWGDKKINADLIDPILEVYK